MQHLSKSNLLSCQILIPANLQPGHSLAGVQNSIKQVGRRERKLILWTPIGGVLYRGRGYTYGYTLCRGCATIPTNRGMSSSTVATAWTKTAHTLSQASDWHLPYLHGWIPNDRHHDGPRSYDGPTTDQVRYSSRGAECNSRRTTNATTTNVYG